MHSDNKLVAQLAAKAKRLEAELLQARAAGRGGRGGVSKTWLALDHSAQPKEEEETWFATYLDMMTLLLVLMIVMLAFAGKGDFISGFDRAGSAQVTGGAGEGENPGAALQKDGTGAHLGGVQQGESLQSELAALGIEGAMDSGVGEDEQRSLSDLGFDQLGDDIDVIINGGVVSFRINSEILFTSGQADLGLAGIAVLKKLVDVLKKNDFQVAVEGHTDSIPIRGRYPSNWELSGSRAGSVVRYFEANGISSERLRAVGFADTRPLESNDTAEGRAQNRRVELTMEIPK